MTNKIHSVTMWSLDFREDGIYIIEGERTNKPAYAGPTAPSKQKWVYHNYNANQYISNKKEYGPITVTNERQWLKSPHTRDLEFIDNSGKKYIASSGNKNRYNESHYDSTKKLEEMLKK